MSKNIVFEGWLTKSPPTKRIWRTVSTTFEALHFVPLLIGFAFAKCIYLLGTGHYTQNNIVECLLYLFLIKHFGINRMQTWFWSLEMAKKVVCLATFRRAPGAVFLRLLCGPELQAAQGHYQLGFMWASKWTVKLCTFRSETKQKVCLSPLELTKDNTLCITNVIKYIHTVHNNG